MQAARAYLGQALALGLVAVWASENLFWSAPRPDFSLIGLALTWGMYALCCAAALSAVMLTGVRGLAGLCLGGALLGWLTEGVIEGTMYDAFPVQLVWTPLAWHMLITSVGVLGVARAGLRWPLLRQALAWAGLGLFGAVWALYWPVERTDQPGLLPAWLYLVGMGVLVVGAFWALDRPAPRALPRTWVLWVAPALLAVFWGLRVVAAPMPALLALPVLIGVTLWAMRRLGKGAQGWPDWQRAAHPARHLLFLIAPLIATLGIVPGWQAGGLPVNVFTLLITAPIGLGLWLWALWRAGRA